MSECEWRASVPGATAAGRLAESLDRIIELVERGRYVDATSAADGGRWAGRTDLDPVPQAVLTEAHAYVVAARCALRRGAHLPDAATRALGDARRVITG